MNTIQQIIAALHEQMREIKEIQDRLCYEDRIETTVHTYLLLNAHINIQAAIEHLEFYDYNDS